MSDYVYLLENRLSADQRFALAQLRTAARDAGTILFLTGDAVRDLTSGHAVRELEVALHGNALKLKKQLEKLGAKIWGEDEPSRTLYLCFPGTVRVDLISTHRLEYPKPGKPIYHLASIHEDLRRRDFTVNSMAISLNEGSYGLLMDPLNGAADIEARTLRLVSSYGFIEDPALLIRVTRLRARLGWEMDPRTQTRYENSKTEGTIEALSPQSRSQELEQIGHEEDGLKVLRALEAEGWMKVLFPAWTSARADEARLTALHDLSVSMLVQGIHPDMSAAQMQLLTAKLPAKDLSALKRSLLRPGFVAEWNNLDSQANGFAKILLAKQNAKPSASYKLFMSYDPEAILWLGFTSRNKEIQERFNLFLKVWPESRQHIPHVLMQEMRITPDLPGYADLLQAIFLELIDGKLTTPEEMRAYLEPHSPPAPPPPVTIKRARARRVDARLKERAVEEEEDETDDTLPGGDDLESIGGDDEELDLGVLPKGALAGDEGDEDESADGDDLDDDEEAAVPAGKKRGAAAAEGKGQKIAPGKPGKPAVPAKLAPAPAPTGKSVPAAAVKVAALKKPAPPPAQLKAKPAFVPVPQKSAKPVPKLAAKTPAKHPAKPPAKSPAKPPAKKAAKPAPAKTAHPKPKPAHAAAKSARHAPASAAKKHASKPAKKR